MRPVHSKRGLKRSHGSGSLRNFVADEIVGIVGGTTLDIMYL